MVAEAVKRSARHHGHGRDHRGPGPAARRGAGNVTDPVRAARRSGTSPAARSVVGSLVPAPWRRPRSARVDGRLPAATAWPDARAPVSAHDLLPERALDGDPDAIGLLVDEVYVALAAEDPALLENPGGLPGADGVAGVRRAAVRAPQHRARWLRRVADMTGLTAPPCRATRGRCGWRWPGRLAEDYAVS